MSDDSAAPVPVPVAVLAGGASAPTNPGPPVVDPRAAANTVTLDRLTLDRQRLRAGEEATGPASGGALLGRILKGRYKLLRLVGEGGMGGVFEGEHLEIGKRVAIKLVHAVHGRDPHIAARIKQEARSTAAIESENIVRVDDAGEDEELGLFLVMELLRGQDLCMLLEHQKELTPLAAAAIAIQAAQGLARAHAAGIVHRDLKPANIFLSTRDDGTTLVKLVDFGIAKLIRDANAGPQGLGLTRMGMVLGTPQYMSPEQAQGLPSVNHLTDIYSLGSVLFEMIVGTSPYPEMPTYEQTILQIMTRPPPRISEFVPAIHPPLDQLCYEMMSHDPDKRPREMAVVRERLVRMLPDLGADRGQGAAVSLPDMGPMSAGSMRDLQADSSGQVRAIVATALLEPRATPATQAALAVSSRLSADEAIHDVAGVPPKRSGAILLGVVAATLFFAAAGIVFARYAGPSAGAGAAADTAATPPSRPAVNPLDTVVAAAPSALASAVPPSSSTTLAASAPRSPGATTLPSGASNGGSANVGPHRPGVAVGPRPATVSPVTASVGKPASATSNAGRPVGGTGVAPTFE